MKRWRGRDLREVAGRSWWGDEETRLKNGGVVAGSLPLTQRSGGAWWEARQLEPQTEGYYLEQLCLGHQGEG